jgi:hypothetical protein
MALGVGSPLTTTAAAATPATPGTSATARKPTALPAALPAAVPGRAAATEAVTARPWHHVRSMPFQKAQKILDFQGPLQPPPTCPRNGSARIKNIIYGTYNLRCIKS